MNKTRQVNMRIDVEAARRIETNLLKVTGGKITGFARTWIEELSDLNADQLRKLQSQLAEFRERNVSLSS